MYAADYWLTASECEEIGTNGREYLQAYKELATHCSASGKIRFPLYAKQHMLDHTFTDVFQHGQCYGFAVNPIAESVQMDEDHVGRTARLSRRVSPKLPAERTIDRYLVAVKQVWQTH